MTTEDAAPRVFISYSWSSRDYSERVLALAEDLVRDGVDVILDRWHLSEGQDAYAFMEQAVTDPGVSRVLILCDPTYAEKADGRSGGVGTETLIISPQVYREAEQTKFVPVIMERTTEGEAPLPAYLSGRFYLDLSKADSEREQYERLLRIIYGKPEVVRPEIGARPSFLDDARPVLLTGSALAQYKDAVLRDKPQQHGYLDAYLARLAQAFRNERIDDAPDAAALLTRIKESIDRFLPYRDEYIDYVRFLGQFGQGRQPFDRVHRLMEELTAERFIRKPSRWDHEALTENLSFLSRELVVYTVASLLRAEQFDGLGRVLARFHVPSESRRGGLMRSVEVLDPPFRQLAQLGGYQGDPVAQMLRERIHDSISEAAWRDAEITLAIRSRLDVKGDKSPFLGPGLWWPQGLGMWWTLDHSPFLTRLGDALYLERALPVFGVTTVDALRRLVAALTDDRSLDGALPMLRKQSLERMFHFSE